MSAGSPPLVTPPPVTMAPGGDDGLLMKSGFSQPADALPPVYIARCRHLAEHPEALELSGDDAMEFFRDQGYALQLAQQQQVLRLFRTEFDVWYSERHLHDSGAVERGFAALDAAAFGLRARRHRRTVPARSVLPGRQSPRHRPRARPATPRRRRWPPRGRGSR